MRVDLIRIGNSRGVREGPVIPAGSQKPREGWKEALLSSNLVSFKSGDDVLLLEGIPEQEFEHDEWTW